MAQHDYIIANQSGAAFRSDLNNGLAAIVSQNSGAAQPSTTYAYQWWADTTTGLLKIRNAANNAWITVGTLGSANLGLLASGNIVNADISASAAIAGSKIAQGTTSDRGTLQLTNSTTSTSTTTAATPAAVKTAVDNAASAQSTANTAQSTANTALSRGGGTMTGNVTFTTAQPRVARAWVNFNGTGTVARRNNFNVSSITDIGVGNYRVVFATAMASADYATVVSSNTGIGNVPKDGAAGNYNTTYVEIETRDINGLLADANYISVAIFL